MLFLREFIIEVGYNGLSRNICVGRQQVFPLLRPGPVSQIRHYSCPCNAIRTYTVTEINEGNIFMEVYSSNSRFRAALAQADRITVYFGRLVAGEGHNATISSVCWKLGRYDCQYSTMNCLGKTQGSGLGELGGCICDATHTAYTHAH